MPYKDPNRRRQRHTEYMMERYHSDEEFRARHREKVRAVNQRTRERNRALIAQEKAKGCSICIEKDPSCLVFHHLDPKQKDIEVSRGVNGLWGTERLLKEVAKCIVLCANCHAKLHAGVIEILPPEAINWSA